VVVHAYCQRYEYTESKHSIINSNNMVEQFIIITTKFDQQTAV